MRRFAILFALPLLAGCSNGSIGSMLDFPGGSSSQEVASAAPATPAPATPAPAGAPNGDLRQRAIRQTCQAFAGLALGG
jgi:hypothetical protein